MSSSEQALEQGIPFWDVLLAFWAPPLELALRCNPRRLFAMSRLQGLSTMLRGEQGRQRRGQLVRDDLVVHDVDPLEDGLVQLAPDLVCGPKVELVRVLQQLQLGVNEGLSDCQIDVSCMELGGEAVAVSRDLAESLADPRLRKRVVRREVEELVLPLVQIAERP